MCDPDIDKRGGFWSNVDLEPAPGAKVVGGFSAGRIPLVRRLAAGAANEKTAIMLDPSYSDGARFDGKTGPDIVTKWLRDDPARRFIFVYSTKSVGWSEYMEIALTDVGPRMRVCSVTKNHADVPGFVTAQLFLDLDRWLLERCDKDSDNP
jgi:hypothetical protein